VPSDSVADDIGDARRGVWTVVVAAGTGERFGTPKQYADLGGRRVLDWSCATAASVSDGVVVVLPATDAGAPGTVAGGATRADSVRNGLAAVPDDADVVCVHDAARPFASAQLFHAVIAAVRAGADGAVPAVAVTDTIKVVDAEGVVQATPERASLVAVQTPQAFRADVLRRAHAGGAQGTDDASLVECVGGRVVTVPGSLDNRKLTHPEDLEWARRQLAVAEVGEVEDGR
jgi:2-C-methyl-D-erythritol 4-phosphate cytidylyltransferase